MQLTRIDRWLQRRFVLETRIQTLRMPGSVPEGIVVRELPEEPGKRFRFLFIIRNDRLAESFVAQLRDENLMFSTTVVDREGRHVKWLAPEGKSFTWRLVSFVAITTACIVGGRYLYAIATNPETIKLFNEAIESVR